MESVLKSILFEELSRIIRKKEVFHNELLKYPKGCLCVIDVHGCEYLCRKYRKGKKVISEYIGPLHSVEAARAQSQREKYISLKKDIKDLEREEKMLRRALKPYERI